MDLAVALQRAAAHASASRVPEVNRVVTVLPAGRGWPAMVVAHDGAWGCAWELDTDVPHVSLPAELLRDRLSGAVSATVALAPYGAAILTLHTKSGGRAESEMAQARVEARVPPLPESWVDVPDWPVVAWAAHAAGKEGTDLGVLVLYKDRAEATDGARMARADIMVGVDAVLPAVMLRRLPPGPAKLAVGPGHVALRVGGEVRYATARRAPRPHGAALEAYAPRLHQGHRAVLPREVLAEAARAAAKASPQGCVAIEVGKGQVTLGSWQEGGGVRARVRARVQGPEARVLVNGDWLADAVTGMRTPAVRLCYRGGDGPLRIEGGAQVAVIEDMKPGSAERPPPARSRR